jgi:hypothetical protein
MQNIVYQATDLGFAKQEWKIEQKRKAKKSSKINSCITVGVTVGLFTVGIIETPILILGLSIQALSQVASYFINK